MSWDRCPQCGEDGKLHAEIESALSRGALDPADRARLAAEARDREGGDMTRGRGILAIVALAAAALLVLAARYVLDDGSGTTAPPREAETARGPAAPADLPPLPAAPAKPAAVPPAPSAPPTARESAPAAPAAAPAPGPAEEAPGAPAPIGELSGVVVGSDGLPVAGAKVEAWCQDSDPNLKPRHFRGESDANGEFRFEGVPAGNWFVDASAEGRAPRRLTGLRLTPDAGLGSLRVVLAGEDPSNTGAVEGMVTGRDGQPVAGALVSVSGMTGGGLVSAETDAGGRYRVGPLVIGEYHVTVTAGGKRSQFVSVTPGQVTRVDFRGGGTLRGIVLDSAGNPLAKAIVRIAPLDEKGRPLDGKYQPSQAVTGEDGRFEIPNVAAGRWQTQIQNLTKGDRYAAQLDPLDLTGEDQEVTLRLRESGIAGRITDAGTGEVPAEMPQITLYVIEPWNHAGMAFMNEDGSYRFRSVPAGNYRLYVHLNGYRTAQLDVTLGDGELKTGVDIAMARLVPGTVIFRVTDVSGAPVEGLQFSVLAADGVTWTLLVESKAPGTYVSTRLESGTHKVTIYRADLKPVTRDVTVVANETTVVELAMEPAPPR